MIFAQHFQINCTKIRNTMFAHQFDEVVSVETMRQIAPDDTGTRVNTVDNTINLLLQKWLKLKNIDRKHHILNDFHLF